MKRISLAAALLAGIGSLPFGAIHDRKTYKAVPNVEGRYINGGRQWTTNKARQANRKAAKALGIRQVKRLRYLDRHEGYAAKHPGMVR